jgi:FkbM family methyltransferase
MMLPIFAERSLAKAMSLMFWAFPNLEQRLAIKLIGRLPKGLLLSEVLASLPIDKILVHGAQGIFEGSAKDVSVIQKYALEQQWSPRTLKRLLDFFAAQGGRGTYLDVGANIGLTAIPIAASGVRVIAFEPVPENYQSLVRNAVSNNAEGNLKAVPIAILDRPGSVTFELSPSNHGDHRYRQGSKLARMGEDSWETTSVEAATLDSFFDEITTPIVLKIDTQGAEPLVFAGAPKVSQLASIVIAEFSPYAMTRMQVDPKIMIEYFSLFGPVEIFEREDEVNPRVMNGAPLSEFLWEYFRQNRESPIGKYLNLFACRN